MAYDVIVVGGGPAGMTAALYALRNGKSVLVIEKDAFGGQMTHSPKLENYPGTVQISGTELAEKMLDQIKHQGAEIENDCVTLIQDKGGFKAVHTEASEHIHCHALFFFRCPAQSGHDILKNAHCREKRIVLEHVSDIAFLRLQIDLFVRIIQHSAICFDMA